MSKNQVQKKWRFLKYIQTVMYADSDWKMCGNIMSDINNQ